MSKSISLASSAAGAKGMAVSTAKLMSAKTASLTASKVIITKATYAKVATEASLIGAAKLTASYKVKSMFLVIGKKVTVILNSAGAVEGNFAILGATSTSALAVGLFFITSYVNSSCM